MRLYRDLSGAAQVWVSIIFLPRGPDLEVALGRRINNDAGQTDYIHSVRAQQRRVYSLVGRRSAMTCLRIGAGQGRAIQRWWNALDVIGSRPRRYWYFLLPS